jgi:hypothetical protein
MISDVMNTCFGTTMRKREGLAHARPLSTAKKIEYLMLENLNTIINRINYQSLMKMYTAKTNMIIAINTRI